MVSANTDGSARIGAGLYSLCDAASLLHVRPATLRSWLSSQQPLVPRRWPDDEAVTFAELMELYVVATFHREGVSLETIRKAAKRAADRFSTHRPFSGRRFPSDARMIFAELIDEAENRAYADDLQRAQAVIEKRIKPFFKKLEFEDSDEVARFWPMEKKGRVVLDPSRQFGKPIDSESGIPTRAIYNACQAGGGQDPKIVAEWFGIPIQAVQAAVAFETSRIE